MGSRRSQAKERKEGEGEERRVDIVPHVIHDEVALDGGDHSGLL
jgi:hypothetical protein